jgi:O-antigen/teichoic acid export membrane protein
VAFRSKWLPRPRLSDVRLHEVRGLISSGKWFFLIALFSGIGYQTDPIVATSVLGASAAAVLAVSNRVFSMLTQCIYPALLQLWPAFTDSLVRGEIAWIRSRLLLASLLAGGLGAAGGVALVVSGPWLIANWLTEDLAPTSFLLGVTAVWTAYSLATAPLMLFLNAVGSVREHALMAIAVGTLNLPLSIILAERVGIEGPIIANLVSNVCCLGIPGAFVVLRVLRRIDADATAS